MTAFTLAFDTTLQCVIRVKVEADSLADAERLARERLEELQSLQINFVDDNATITEASVVHDVPYHDDHGPTLFQVGDVDIDDACSECGADTTNGEGYDGRCGDCADKHQAIERRAKMEARADA